MDEHKDQEMKLYMPCHKPASEVDIYAALRHYQSHVYAPKSNYHVVSIAEFCMTNGNYFYTLGVNVEMPHSNKLGLHGEQSAVLAGIALLGSGAKFSRVWIMASPAAALPIKGEKSGMPCGKCRQILCSLAAPYAEIWGVNLAGEFAGPYRFEDDLLMHPFKESDVFPDRQKRENQIHKMSNHEWAKSEAVYPLLEHKAPLAAERIQYYFQQIKPHILCHKMKTSCIDSCVLECGELGYAIGSLIQDVAYLTTDAILLAVGQAVALYGSVGLAFSAIHVYGEVLSFCDLPFTDIELLLYFTSADIQVYFHSVNELKVCTLGECIEYRKNVLINTRLASV